MFNQLTLTCAFVDEAIPCRHASQFQYLNEVIHKPAEPFLTDADVTSGFSYYSNRIMSDGARARAFEDSHLMAQIGGSHQSSADESLKETQLAQQPQESVQPRPLAVPEALFKLDSGERETSVNSLEPQPQIETFQTLVNHGSHETHQSQVSAQQRPTASYPGLQADLFGQQNSGQPASHQLALGWPQPGALPAKRAQAGQNSFDFAIATEHQRLPSEKPTSLVFVNQFTGQDHQVALQQQNPVSSPLSPHAPLPPQPQPQPQHTEHQQGPPATEQPERQDSAQARARLSPSLSLMPLTSTELNQIIATTTQLSQRANLAAATTPVAPAQATTTLASPVTSTLAPTTSTSGRRTSSTNQARSRGQAQAGERLSGGFQSTRLSGARGSQAQAGVIMRRQALASSPKPAQQTQHQASPVRQQVSSPTPFVPIESGSGFWRRAFNAQLMAPRFESLLTRRRV